MRILVIFFFAILSHFLSAQSAIVYGTINDSTGAAVPFVQVSFVGDTGEAVYSTGRGYYEINIPSDTLIQLSFTHGEFHRSLHPVKLPSGERKEVNKTLRSNVLKVVEIRRENINDRERGGVRLDPKILTLVPSPNQDIGATIKLIVGSNNEMTNQYAVRGGNFDENLVYVNGIEVYRPLLTRSGQQEGLSFVNTDMTEGVYFSTGGFESVYGDKLSSVLDITYRRPQTFGGTVAASLLGGNVHLEGRHKRFSFLLGGRYKSHSYLLRSLDTQGDYQPVFADGQGLFTFDFTDQWKLEFLGNYASNEYLFIPQNRTTEFGTVNEALQLQVYFDGREISKFKTSFGALALNYRDKKDSLHLKFITSAFYSMEDETFDVQGQYRLNELENDFGDPDFGDVAFNLGVGTFLDHARNYLDVIVLNAEHKGEIIKRKNHFQWGIRGQQEIIEDKLSEWSMVDSAGYSLPFYPLESLDLQDVIKTTINIENYRGMGFVQNKKSWRLRDTSRISLTAGVRANYNAFNSQLVISPRTMLTWKPYWKKDFLFRFSAGYYYQPPFYRELRDLSGRINPAVRAQRSIHFVLGSDYNFKAWGRDFKFISEAYYKHLTDIIPYEIENVRIRYYANNNAKGYAAGLDLKVNGEFIKGTSSWVNLSFLRTREDILDDFYYKYYNSDGELIIPGFTQNSVRADSQRFEPGYIPRPADQLLTFSMFFQDEMPKLEDFKMNLGLIFGAPMPFGPPSFERYKDTLKMPPYRRVDIGFSYELVKPSKPLPKKNPFHVLKAVWIGLEVFNLLQTNNTISYLWIQDVSGRQYAVPNYLSNRRVSLRTIIRF